MENNSITEQRDVGVISCAGCDEHKSKQFKLHLMNKGQSRKGKEMSDKMKAKRQEISAQHPGELKASPLSLHKKSYKRSAMKKTECSELLQVDAQRPTTDWNIPGCPKQIAKKLFWAISLSSTASLALLQAEVLELNFYALHYEKRYVFNQRIFKEGRKKKILQQHKTKLQKVFPIYSQEKSKCQ